MRDDELTAAADADLLAQVRDAVKAAGSTDEPAESDADQTTVAASDELAEIVAEAKALSVERPKAGDFDHEKTIPPPAPVIDDVAPSVDAVAPEAALEVEVERPPDAPESPLEPISSNVIPPAEPAVWQPPRRLSPTFQPTPKAPIEVDPRRAVFAGVMILAAAVVAVAIWWFGSRSNTNPIVVVPGVEDADVQVEEPGE